ncbi:properdin [Cynoglossus semilaevis]|uniref:Complement factor properdin n=1 Tax=Cynoglossus semilaevis TaxID=244447 RepID=A0A3P8VEI0_CYNSE|nr:properdin [Cynoglossus semilaevis]
MDVLPVLLLLLSSAVCSECVRCFAGFNLTLGQCSREVGDVNQKECCQNPDYGFLTEDGSCQSCGVQTWSPWSSWSHCNVLCGEGVRQRSRKCFGVLTPECHDPPDTLETEACDGTCCDAKGWSSWNAWSSCSVTCGVGGVRKRERVCSSPPDCHLSCIGLLAETEPCPNVKTCPVHGSWSPWAPWSGCSGTCIDNDIIPHKSRQRSCSSPAPSTDTEPPGDSCSGSDSEVSGCTELPNCPVHGNWGEWALPGPCSSACGEGLQMSVRLCDNPAPNYGGKYCEGTNARTQECRSQCPVHGFWTGWSAWSDCSSSCATKGNTPMRSRSRSCSNPAPSSSPRGKDCMGNGEMMEKCANIPPCSVDGGWTPWSPFTPCPVTCGVGAQHSHRSCTNPAPQHGGKACDGEAHQRRTCSTAVHCPVHGSWSEWTSWTDCIYRFGVNKPINCKKMQGKQNRERECLHRAHNGSFCIGTEQFETRGCYSIGGCLLKGNWQGWGDWSLCRPACGGNPIRFRRKICEIDYSIYNNRENRIAYHGKPTPDCDNLPEGEVGFERKPCHNVPPCAVG